MEAFNPQPHEWYAATIYYTNICRWAFANLDDGTEIFVPASVKAGITSENLAVQLKPPAGTRRRFEVTAAMALEDYYKLLDEHIPEAVRPVRAG
jgi:hypothetical protein